MKRRNGFSLIELMIVVGIFAIIAAMVIPNLLPAPEPTPEMIAERAATVQRIRENKAEQLIRDIVYVKDERTGLCFACAGLDSYSQSIAMVPEASIPPELLVTAPKK